MERESVSSHINYETLQQNFHLPISQVAKELGVCATVLKKLCRQHGIPRWPHRKIKSLNKMISVLETTKSETEEEEQQRIIELKALLKKKEDIMDNPSIIGPTYSHISPRCGGTKPLGSNINKFAHSSTKTISSSVNYSTFSPNQLPIQTQIHTHLQNQMQNQQAQITQSYLSQSASSIPKLQQQQQHSLNYAQTQGNLSTSLRTSEGNIHEQSVRALLQQKLSCISHSALQSSTSPCRRSPDIVHSAMLPYTSNFRTTPRSRTMSSPQILDNNMNVARPRFNYVPNASANPGELTDSNGNQTNGFSVPNSTNPFSFSRSSAFSQPDPALMSMISPMTMTAIAPVYSSSDLTSGGFIHFPSGNPARASSVPPQFLIPSLNPNNNNNNNSNNNNTNNNNNINIDTTSNNLGDSNGNLSSSNNANNNNNNNVANLNDSEGSIRTTTDGNSTNMHSAGMNFTLNIPGGRLASSHQENTDYSENNTTTTINSTNGTNVIRTLNNGSVGNNSNNDGNSSNNNHHHHQHHHHQLSNMNGNEAHYVAYPSKLPDLCGLEEKNATVGTIGNGGADDDEDDYYYESTTSNTPPHTMYSYGLDPVSHH